MLKVTVILYEDNLSKEQVRNYLKDNFDYKGRFETIVLFHIYKDILYIVTSRNNPDINISFCELVRLSEVMVDDIEVMKLDLSEGKIIERKKRALEHYRGSVNDGYWL